jgi:hypothetical protein
MINIYFLILLNLFQILSKPGKFFCCVLFNREIIALISIAFQAIFETGLKQSCLINDCFIPGQCPEILSRKLFLPRSKQSRMGTSFSTYRTARSLSSKKHQNILRTSNCEEGTNFPGKRDKKIKGNSIKPITL